SEKNFDKAPNTAIDFFLHTLAQDQRSRAIAIILSGTGTDGSKGIQSIQEHGGMVLVQDPLTAKFDGMPNAAIATGVAELILAPELMPEEIFHYINERPFHLAVEGKPSENSLPEVLKLVERNCHQDFTNYKSPTILRRIGRRMGILGLINFNDYLELLRTSNEECKFLGKEFLIGVTKFFRDEAAFQIIREKVLPHIIASKKDGELIKIWVTACSTGEEAYSLAILIDDLLQKTGRSLDVKIFATDIDADAIETASKALYPSVSIAELDEDLKRRYFFNEGNNIQVQAFLRKQIVFARHNILKDPPFIKNDMATCRNMLIYMNNVLQRKVLSTLQFSLNTGGFLFLGPSETPASIKEHLDEINGKWKIFRKISNESGYDPERLPSTQTYRREIKYNTVSKEKAVAKELADDMRELLTTEYGYAAVYIDRNNEIKEAIGDFRKYLSLPDRLSSMNILKMVPPEVSVILNTAIRKAIKDNNKVAMHHVRMKSNEEEKSLNIFIRPSSKNELLLVVFGETRESYSQKIFTDFVQPQHPASVSYIAELEEELKETRGHLQMAIENLETANEELQSSNEELLSANEELQSGNEELQSLNEELHTVNAELQMRIKELVELNDDLENYFSSSEVAQVFIDRELRIRKFNPVAIRMINL
ncbi:MAG TPA: CheR family methyltransferase, partial [Flavisolibacter sp.]|nr:CheR family methyltransferase [Flavisolibacter sp.]